MYTLDMPVATIYRILSSPCHEITTYDAKHDDDHGGPIFVIPLYPESRFNHSSKDMNICSHASQYCARIHMDMGT